MKPAANNSGQPTPRNGWFPSSGQSRGAAAFKRSAQTSTTMSKILLDLCSCLALTGCGGIAERVTRAHLSVIVTQKGNPLANQTVISTIRAAYSCDLGSPLTAITDARGCASFERQIMWGCAYLLLPPIGPVPRRPAKPEYLVSVGGRKHLVTPQTPASTYLWRAGGWYTEIMLDFPGAQLSPKKKTQNQTRQQRRRGMAFLELTPAARRGCA